MTTRPRTEDTATEELPPIESGLDATASQALLDEHWDKSIIPALSDFIAVPSQSPLFDPEWETNGLLDKSIAILVAWVEAQGIEGLSVETVTKKGFTPVIFIEVEPTAKVPAVSYLGVRVGLRILLGVRGQGCRCGDCLDVRPR
jgi:hypothetical protein